MYTIYLLAAEQTRRLMDEQFRSPEWQHRAELGRTSSPRWRRIWAGSR
jgi:hypothetical protein